MAGNVTRTSGTVAYPKFVEAWQFARKEICGEKNPNAPITGTCQQQVYKRLCTLWHATNAIQYPSLFKRTIGGLSERVSAGCKSLARKSNPHAESADLVKTNSYAVCVKEIMNDNLSWLDRERKRLGMPYGIWCVGPAIKPTACHTNLSTFLQACIDRERAEK